MKKFHSVLQRHANMIFDFARTTPLLKAIQKKVRPGDVVADVGAGLGILSIAACLAGAKRVYAIDVDEASLDFAQWQAKQLNLEKKICFLHDHSRNIDLVEKADLLIQETMGPLGFDENFLPTLIDAKKRFLKTDGKIIPAQVRLVGNPIGAQKKLLTTPTTLLEIQTKKVGQQSLKVHKQWKLKTNGPCHGILLWPHIVWAKGLVTDCSPLKPMTHWGQTLLSLESKKKKRSAIDLTLNIIPHPHDLLHYSEICWKVF